MPTQILAVGTTAANSTDQVVAASTALTVCLKDSSGPDLPEGVFVEIQLKDDAGQYFRIDTLTTSKPAVQITAPGTYRFARREGPACGVFSG